MYVCSVCVMTDNTADIGKNKEHWGLFGFLEDFLQQMLIWGEGCSSNREAVHNVL